MGRRRIRPVATKLSPGVAAPWLIWAAISMAALFVSACGSDDGGSGLRDPAQR